MYSGICQKRSGRDAWGEGFGVRVCSIGANSFPLISGDCAGKCEDRATDGLP